MPETKDLEVHKALADDTRYRLYRYLGLAGRPASVQEMARRLSLHPNTLRPHLRRLEEAGLVEREIRKGATVGRPQTLYSIREPAPAPAGDHRLLAEILAGSIRGKRALDDVERLAQEWGTYMVSQGGPKPGVRLPAGRNLAILQEAMARAGFEPRFRRTSATTVEVSLRDCPFRDLVEERRDLVEAVHRGLLTGMLAGLKPALRIKEFKPFAEKGICRVVAGGR
jgi:predicted ArsR family transcriptional regulator